MSSASAAIPPDLMPTLEPMPESVTRLGDAYNIWSGSVADWAVECVGVCTDFDGLLVSPKTVHHIVGS